MSRVVREPDRQLSPWDQAPYFQPVKETRFSNIGVGIQVALADPSRIGIIFGVHGSGTVDISTLPSVNVGQGLPLSATLGVLSFTHHDFGPLVQQAWYAALSGASPALTVIEILLAKWPGEQ